MVQFSAGPWSHHDWIEAHACAGGGQPADAQQIAAAPEPSKPVKKKEAKKAAIRVKADKIVNTEFRKPIPDPSATWSEFKAKHPQVTGC